MIIRPRRKYKGIRRELRKVLILAMKKKVNELTGGGSIFKLAYLIIDYYQLKISSTLNTQGGKE